MGRRESALEHTRDHNFSPTASLLSLRGVLGSESERKSHFNLAEVQEMRAEVMLKMFNNWDGMGMDHAEEMLAVPSIT